jgi:hypothetical protein
MEAFISSKMVSKRYGQKISLVMNRPPMTTLGTVENLSFPCKDCGILYTGGT